MLDVSTSLFASEGSFVVPLIKEVTILSSLQEQEQLKSIDIVVKIYLIQNDPGPLPPINVHLSAIKDEAVAKALHIGDPESNLRALIVNQFETEKRQYKNLSTLDYMGKSSPVVCNREEGGPVYYRSVEIPMTVTYTNNIDYLCLVALVSETFDTNSTSTQSFKQYFQQREFKISTPSIETALVNGTPPMRSNVFLLQTDIPGYGKAGELWPSTVHENATNNLMAGPQHISDVHPGVVAAKVANLKIKDYRMEHFHDIFEPPPDPDAIVGHEYISPLYFSRSINNAAKIFFSFDFKNFMKDNSDLSYAFKDKFSLMSTATVTEIKVYRERVNATDLGNRLTPGHPAEGLSCSDRNYKKLIARLSDGTVKFVNASRFTSNGIYEIIAFDTEMANKGEGKYKYSVEIQITDNSAGAVNNIIEHLRYHMSQLESYLLKFFNYEKKNYDVESYINAMASFTQESASWKGLIVAYLSSLVFLTGAQMENFSTTVALRNLMALASPQAASHASLLKFKEHINNFILLLEKSITKTETITSRPYSDSTLSFQSKIHGASALSKRIKYEPRINQLYHNDLAANVGINYLGDKLVNGGANRLDRIGINYYGDRISEEINKYNVGNTSGVNKYGFLSPHTIKTPDNDIAVGLPMPLALSLSLLAANSLPINQVLNFTGSPLVEGVENADIDSLLSLSGVSSEAKESCADLVSLRDFVSTGSPLGTIDSSFYFSLLSRFIHDDTSDSEDNTSRVNRMTTASRSFGSSVAVRSILENLPTGFQQLTSADTSTIQGSYAAALISTALDAFLSLNIFEKSVLFNSVVRVEYLANYENGVRDPVWLLLDETAIDNIQKNNRSVLCRLAGPNKVLSAENKFNLSMYSGVFVLGSSKLQEVPAPFGASSPIGVLRQQLYNIMTSGLLNTTVDGNSPLTQYTCSDMMIYKNLYIPGASSGTPSFSTTFMGGTY